MEKIIEIDLFDKYDLTEKYNDKHLSSELLEYIIEQATFVTKRNTVKIVINKKCPMEQDCIKIITDELKQEYNSRVILHGIFITIATIAAYQIGLHTDSYAVRSNNGICSFGNLTNVSRI